MIGMRKLATLYVDVGKRLLKNIAYEISKLIPRSDAVLSDVQKLATNDRKLITEEIKKWNKIGGVATTEGLTENKIGLHYYEFVLHFF